MAIYKDRAALEEFVSPVGVADHLDVYGYVGRVIVGQVSNSSRLLDPNYWTTSSAALQVESGVSWSVWMLFGPLLQLLRPTRRRRRYCSKAGQSLCGSGY